MFSTATFPANRPFPSLLIAGRTQPSPSQVVGPGFLDGNFSGKNEKRPAERFAQVLIAGAAAGLACEWSFLRSRREPRRKKPQPAWLSFGVPVFMVAQEETLIVRMQGRVHKEAHQIEMTHFFKAAICSHDVTGHDGEAAARHFLT